MTLPTAEHLSALELQTIQTAIDRAWVDPATGLPQTDAELGSRVREQFNALRSSLGFAMVVAPEPAFAYGLTTIGPRAIDVP